MIIRANRRTPSLLGGIVAFVSSTLLFSTTWGCHGSGEEEVGPGEDLMREHGVLRRVMLADDEIARRLTTGEPVPQDAVLSGARIVRRVIEDYHEQLEEQYLFPRLRQAGKLSELVSVLTAQHQAGRRVTDDVLRMGQTPPTDDTQRRSLANALHQFTTMYRPHAAREDTVLFPAFHQLVGEKTYRELGEQFEDKEHETLGKAGFEGAVADVDKLEQELGIDQLGKFTPR